MRWRWHLLAWRSERHKTLHRSCKARRPQPTSACVLPRGRTPFAHLPELTSRMGAPRRHGGVVPPAARRLGHTAVKWQRTCHEHRHAQNHIILAWRIFASLYMAMSLQRSGAIPPHDRQYCCNVGMLGPRLQSLPYPACRFRLAWLSFLPMAVLMRRSLLSRTRLQMLEQAPANPWGRLRGRACGGCDAPNADKGRPDG